MRAPHLVNTGPRSVQGGSGGSVAGTAMSTSHSRQKLCNRRKRQQSMVHLVRVRGIEEAARPDPRCLLQWGALSLSASKAAKAAKACDSGLPDPQDSRLRIAFRHLLVLPGL